jgi:hypothetical protein
MGEQGQAEREKFENELKRILGASDQAGVLMRVIGSLAFQMHCENLATAGSDGTGLHRHRLLAAYKKQVREVKALMSGLGYVEDREVFIVSEGDRAILTTRAPPCTWMCSSIASTSHISSTE